MGYRPTGRSAGRPRGPVTPDGKLAKARKDLPHMRAFPEMVRAVDRAMYQPDRVVQRDWTADARDVDVVHTYTPKERGQILSFVWWVYVNRAAWPRRKLTAAITSVSPLMLFSSTFLAEMSGIPSSTATKNMIRSPEMKVSRVTGSCDMWVIQQLLLMASEGHDRFRALVRELALEKGVPKALLCRISGIPLQDILRTERGIQFFPEAADWELGEVVSVKDSEAYKKKHKEDRKSYDPRPGNQRSIRDVLTGTELGHLRATSSPVPDDNHLPYHLCIPGLPTLRKNQKPDQAFFDKITDWECTYHLPATTGMGS